MSYNITDKHGTLEAYFANSSGIVLNDTYTISSEVSKYAYLRSVSKPILLYSLPLIMIIGTVGNVLSLIVLMRRRMRVKSVYFYLSVLACSDTLVLYVSAFRYWISMLTGFDFLYVSSITCKVTIFLILFSQHMSAWLIGLLTVDRFISVLMPFQAASYCTVERARAMTTILSAAMAVYNSYVFFTFDLYTVLSKPRCTIQEDSSFRKPFEYLKTTTYVIAPSIAVLVLNSCIICQVLRKRDPVLQVSSRNSQGVGSARVLQQKNKVTMMLLVVSFTWLFLTTPYGLLSVIPVSVFDDAKDLYMFLRIICFLLFYVNHSANFYLYCLTGRKFRYECLEFYAYICRCGRFYFGNQRTIRTQRTPLGVHLDNKNDTPKEAKRSKSSSSGERVRCGSMLIDQENDQGETAI